MPTRVDEPVAVTLSAEGEPQAFVWRRFEYDVFGVPQAFYRRRKWWQRSEPLTSIDLEVWRVEASASGTSTDARTFDIVHHSETAEWWLESAWE